MNYYVQKFENTQNGGDTKCYGEMSAHNHAHANQFTTDVIEYLVNTIGWNRMDIRTGPFRSGQPRPAHAKQFNWSAAANRWVKI